LGGDVPGARSYNLDEKTRLIDAMKPIDVVRDSSKRHVVLDELKEQLGEEFDPSRLSASGNAFALSLLNACIRLGAVRQLVEVLSVVGSPREAVESLVAVADELVPRAVLTADERKLVKNLLTRVPASTLAEVFNSQEPAEWREGAPKNVDEAIQLLESRVEQDADAALALLTILERCSHYTDSYSQLQLHQVVRNAASRWGLLDKVGEVCQQIIGQTSASGEDFYDESPPQTHMPDITETPGEEDVRTDQAPAAPPETLRRPAPAIMGGVPPRNPNFTGREDVLQRLRSAMTHDRRAAVLPHTLQGLGGIGKSQLATEYAYRSQFDYDLIWWLPSEDELSIRRSLVSLARRLKLPESIDADNTIENVLDALRRGQPHPEWLMVYDGAGEPGVVHSYLPSGDGHVLITSRNRSWISQSTILELDVFQPSESLEFLTQRWADLSQEEAHALAERLGNLPLALEQAVAVHTETGMPLAQYLELLEEHPAKVLDEGQPTEYPHSVARTLRLAFEQLNDRSQAAAQLLEICAFLSSNAIAVPMLARGRGATLPSPLSETLRDDLKMRGAVRDLGRYALAQLDASRDFIKIHMLVRAILRDEMPEDQRRATERSAHELLALANPGTPDSNSTWPQHAEIAPHVIPSGVIMSDDPHVRRIVLDQIRYYFVVGDYAESARLARHAVESWRGSLGPDNEMTLMASFHLGNALRALGDYSTAREVAQDALLRMQRVLGEEHEYTLRAANSHAADYRLLGDFLRALQIDEANLAIYNRLLGADDQATLRVANNLAVDHRLLGHFQPAKELDEDTLSRRRAVLSPQSPELLSSASNLVRDIYGVGDYEQARIKEDENIATFSEWLPKHIFLLLARRNQAILWRKTGHYGQALKMSDETYDDTRDRFGLKHEHTLAAMMTLANALRVSGDLTAAYRVGNEAVELYQSNFGGAHPFTLACASNLAITLRALGRVDEALALDQRTLKALEKTVGPDHPYVLCCSCGLANDLSMMGEHSKARKISEKLLERSEQVRVEDHPYTLACAANLALDLDDTGAHNEATKLRNETKARMRQRLGAEHPETVNVERARRAECDNEVPPT
jgi:tetratricopeptide (TPR) repeat protein